MKRILRLLQQLGVRMTLERVDWKLADRDRFDLDAEAAEAWAAINARPARDLPGLRRLMDRPSPFVE